MEEEDNKEIANEAHTEVKKHKKKKKKKHRKASNTELQSTEIKKEEPKIESIEPINNNEETKIESNIDKEKTEIINPESVKPSTETEENNKSPSEIIISKNEETKQETKEEIKVEENNKKTKKKKKGKKKNKKDGKTKEKTEEKIEENNEEINKENNEEKNEEKIEEKNEEKIEEKNEDKKEEINEENNKENNEEKNEEKIEDKIEEKIEDKIEEKTEDKLEEKKEEKIDEKIEDKNEEKTEEKDKEINIEDNSIKIGIENNLHEEQKISIANNKENNNLDIKEYNNIYPEKDIDPLNLISVDEDDGEIDYLKAEQAYDLSVLLESHKFIRNTKNKDKKFINLIRRQIIRYERNLYELSLNNDKFFILYELQVSKNTNISLMDTVILDTINSILFSYPEVHLIIFISDEELLNSNPNEFDDSTIDKISKEKLSNILLYLNLDSDTEKRIHAFSSKRLKSKNEIFQHQKEDFKNIINKTRTLKLFNLCDKSEESDLFLEYPCCLAIAANPLIYSKYIPEITSDYKCLIINSIFYIYRYELCFSASKPLSFPQPSIISLKILPPIKDINDQGINYDLKDEIMIYSSDDKNNIDDKIKQLTNKDEGININRDILFQYLSYLVEDDEKYNDFIKNYNGEKENDLNLNESMIELIEKKFENMGNKDIKDIDLNKYFVDIS